jgi:hypothetical protein
MLPYRRRMSHAPTRSVTSPGRKGVPSYPSYENERTPIRRRKIGYPLRASAPRPAGWWLSGCLLLRWPPPWSGDKGPTAASPGARV